MQMETHQKVTASHLQREAYLYIRQSTLRQVIENTESTRRQYALRERAVQLGWSYEQTDWHRLLEICALTDSLILDEDGVYDLGPFNDQLLLGLKGTMSEAELHVLRARLRGGILSKARRDELRRPGCTERTPPCAAGLPAKPDVVPGAPADEEGRYRRPW